MTSPTRSAPPTANPRDVAKHLDRRRMRRRLIGWTSLLAAVAAGAMYMRCGTGLGLGGAGKGPGGAGKGPGGAGKELSEGSGESRRLTTAPRRCAIRVTSGGITVDGKPMLRDEVVAACKATAGADVVITGDTREGDWKNLQSALRTAGVPDIVVHQPPGAGSDQN